MVNVEEKSGLDNRFVFNVGNIVGNVWKTTKVLRRIEGLNIPVCVRGYHKSRIPDVYQSNHFVSYFLQFFPSL